MGECILWSHDIELDAHTISASRARAFVRLHLGEHGLVHLSDDVELVVSELATNAIAHARTPFTVSLHAFDLTLLLEVEDGSRTRPTHIEAHLLDSHGRGIFIVNAVCRDWGVDALPNGGKSVWAEFGTLGPDSLLGSESLSPPRA